MKLLCRIGFHNWGLWDMPVRGYMKQVQHRFCKDCGKQDNRTFYGEQTLPEKEHYINTVIKENQNDSTN